MDQPLPQPSSEHSRWLPRVSEHKSPCHVETAVSRSPSPGARLQPTRQLLFPDVIAGTANTSRHGSKIDSVPMPRRAHFWKNWWLEIVACLISVLALLAIAVTLRPHESKPLPQWPYNISVNTLISIYAVALKATVLLVTAEGLGQLKWQWFRNDRSLQDVVKYDEATRGPLGSLHLLWSLGLQYPLSSCGALITILILAIDPFTQQIIRYNGCSLAIQGQQATIPRTNVPLGGGAHVGAGLVSIPNELQSAINAGIFSPGSLVTPSCPTGNCSFPASYSTIAFCGGCTDITNSLKFDTTSPSVEKNVPGNVLSYLPSGTQINTSFSHEQDRATMRAAFNHEAREMEAEFIVIKSLEYLGNQSQKDTCQGASDTWNCLGYGAASCAIDVCIRTYTGTISAGEFHETWSPDDDDGITGHVGIFGRNKSPLSTYPMTWMATVDTQCISLDEQSSLLQAGYLVDPKRQWLPYNMTFDPTVVSNSSFPSSLLQHGCLYAVDEFFVNSIWPVYLDGFFVGTVNATRQQNSSYAYYGPQNLQTIYNYSNVNFASIDSTFRNISDSMTTYIRQRGNENHSAPAIGLVMHNDTCLQVRWGGLAFPAALVLSTVLFFATMVIDTRPTGERVQIWKSSPLAFIFHGLEEPNCLHGDESLNEIRGMERAAEGIRVRLASTEKGTNLVAVGDERPKEK